MTEYIKILKSRICELKIELESEKWVSLESYIKGKIDAYEEIIKDFETGVLIKTE